MKKNLGLGLLLGFAFVFVLAPVYAAKDSETTFQEIKKDLKAKGVPADDIKDSRAQIKEMIEKGATKAEIENPLLDLSKSGIKGKDFKKSVEQMKDMVKEGETPSDAGNMVSQAVHQAQSEGLKGKALADRVHQAVKAMQAQKKAAQALKKQQKEEAKAAKEHGKGTEDSMEASHGHGMGEGHGQGHGK